MNPPTAGPSPAPDTAIAGTNGRYCPCCDKHLRQGFDPGPDGRPDATCPRCSSLERHRFFALLLGALRPQLGRVGTLLDVAPAPQPRKRLRELEPAAYIGIDLRPHRGVDLQGSLTQLPFRDGCIDLLVCYHVLEHVPQDLAAISELRRILADDGLGILQVPWRPWRETEEDLDASPEEKLRRFGLDDHVRYYGIDFEQRLVDAGLDVVRVTPQDYVGAEANAWMGLGQDQSVWLVRPARAGADAWTIPTESPLTRMLDSLVTELAQTRNGRREARQALKKAGLSVEG